jgi:hypothetical protein
MAYNDPNAKSDGDILAIGDYNILRNNWLASVLATVSAKGDLSVATAANAIARLAVGANDSILVADSGETTGLAWQIQPACRVYNDAAISASSATWTTLTFNQERFDINGMHDTSTNAGRITIPANGDGLYLIGASLAIEDDGDTKVRFLLNGTTVIAQHSEFYDTGSGPTYIHYSITTFYSLSATDYVEVQVYPANNTVNVAAAGNYSPEFWAIWQRRQ